VRGENRIWGRIRKGERGKFFLDYMSEYVDRWDREKKRERPKD
jgi:hypothetical protein